MTSWRDNNLFAKLLQVVQRRWSLAVEVLNSKDVQEAEGLVAFIEQVSKPEAHPSLQERISELQSELQTLSFHSAVCRKIQAEIDNILKKKVLKNHRMAFTFINRNIPPIR